MDVLPGLVHGYNRTYHRSIRRAPAQVNAKNVLKVWNGKSGKPETFALKVADRIRINKAKQTFEKGYISNWTTELFTISRKVPGRNVYRIEDDHGEKLEGTFYAKELQQDQDRRCLRSRRSLGL
jgi:hypothetical protein